MSILFSLSGLYKKAECLCPETKSVYAQGRVKGVLNAKLRLLSSLTTRCRVFTLNVTPKTIQAISRSSQCSTPGVTKTGICYAVCGMMHIKEPLLLIGKSSPCGGSGFHLLLSERSFTICVT